MLFRSLQSQGVVRVSDHSPIRPPDVQLPLVDLLNVDTAHSIRSHCDVVGCDVKTPLAEDNQKSLAVR